MAFAGVVLGLLAISFASPSTTTGVPLVDVQSQVPLEQFLNQQVQKFQVEYHRTLETGRLRRKRDTGRLLHLTAQEDPPRRHKISSLAEAPNIPLDLRVTSWTWFQPDFASTYLLLLLHTNDGHLVLLGNQGQEFEVVLKVSVVDKAHSAQAFVSGPSVWFAVVHENHETGRHYIQMYQYKGELFLKQTTPAKLFLKQTIPLDGKAELAVVYNRGFWYMAVATPNKLALYEWRQTQYDFIAAATVLGLRSVAVWSSSAVIYIATAVNSGRSGSSVFTYTRKEGRLLRLQVLPVYSASKVTWFKVDGNDYLLFVGQNEVVLYWRAGNMFLQYQILESTSGAIDTAVLILPNGEAAIAIAFENEVRFYVEGFSSEYYMSFSRSSGATLSAGFGFFFQANLHYFLLLTYDFASLDSAASQSGSLPDSIWRLNVTNYYDLHEPVDPLSGCIKNLEEKLVANRHTLEYIEANLDKVWVRDKEQSILVPVIIQGKVEIHEGIQVDRVTLQGPEDLLVVPQITSGVLRTDLLDQKLQLKAMELDLGNLVYKSENQVINGDLTFLQFFKTGNLELPSLVNDVVINGFPLSVLAENTLRTVGEQVLVHNLEITHIESQNIIVQGKLNGIRPQDAVLLHQDERIQCELHFTNLVTQDINLLADGTVNGIEPSTFVLKNSPQVIHGVKTFHNLVVQKDIVIHGLTNQHDFSVFVQNILNLGNADVPDFSNVEFASPVTVEGDVYIEGLINGVIDLKDLATRTLDLTSNQIVRGKKTITKPIFVNGNVNVDGLTNGVDVSEQVLTLSTDQFIPGTVTFDSFEVVGDLFPGTVNGYDLSMEAVTIQGPPQIITGHKTFKESVQVLLDVVVRNGSTINELDLSALVEAATRTDNVVLLGSSTFHSLTIQEVIASDSINGISLDHLFHNVWRKSTDQVIPPIELVQPILVESNMMVSNDVNSYDLAEDFVHVYGNEEITGYVRFTDKVFVEGSLHMAPGRTINGFDVSEYNRSVVPSRHDSIIHSHIIFSSLEVRGNLIINREIDGINLDNLMQTDKPQVITGNVKFLADKTTLTGNLNVDRLFLEKDINGVDFSEFNKHVVYDFHSNPEIMAIVENKEFLGGLSSASLVSHGTVSGIDLNSWFLEAVRLSTEEEINGFKNLSDVEFLGGFTVDHLNGEPLNEYLSSVVLNTADRIRGPKTIQGSVTVNDDLVLKNLLNGVNLLLLQSEAAFIDADNVFSGMVIINGNLELDSLELSDSSSLDGILWSQLVFVDQNQALTGITTFPDGVSTSQATVKRLVNGCDITKLSEEAIYLGRPLPNLDGPLTVRTLVVHGDLNLSGRIGGLHIPSFSQAILNKSGHQTITGAVQFTDLRAASVQLGLINQLDLSTIMKDSVLNSQSQVISGVKRFVHVDGVTVLDNLIINNNVEVDGQVNGFDLSALMEVTILKDVKTTISGLKNFSEIEVLGDIYIHGLLNGISIPSGIILLESDEEIRSSLTLRNTSTVAQLYIGRHVDGVHLQQLIENRVTLLHDQEIFANVEFVDTLTTDSLQVFGLVNNIPVKDIILRHSGVHISDQKVFENSVNIVGSLSVHKLNGIDLQEFTKELVRVNQAQEISQLIEFVTEVDVQNDLVIEESINNIELHGLEQKFADYHRSLSQELSALQAQISILERHILSSREQLVAREFWELLHFQLFQSFEIQLAKLFVSPLQKGSMLEDAEDRSPSVSHKLLGWSSSCDAVGCCSSSVTHVFEMDHFGRLTPLSTEPGRLFPLFAESPIAKDNLHGFVLWTNTSTHSQLCTIQQREAMSIVSVTEESLIGIAQRLHQAVSSSIQNVKLFKAQNEVYLLITSLFNKFTGNTSLASVFRYNHVSSSWLIHQFLGGSEGTTSMDLTTLVDIDGKKHILAALTDSLDLYLYRWNDQNQFDLVAKIPSPGVSSSLWIKAEGQLYLVLSMPDVQLLNIYVYTKEPVDDSRLAWFQGVELSGVNVLHGFLFSGEAYIAAASRTSLELIILQWKGQEGFTPIQRLPISGIRDITSYWSTSMDMFLAISTDCGIIILKAVAFGFGHNY